MSYANGRPSSLGFLASLGSHRWYHQNPSGREIINAKIKRPAALSAALSEYA